MLVGNFSSARKNKNIEGTESTENIEMFAALILLTIGSLFAYIVGTWLLKRQAALCPKYKYVYRPAARSFIEEQTQPPSVFKIHQDMFWKQSPWVSTHENPAENANGYINPFVLGGLPGTDLGTTRESTNFLNDTF